MSRYTKMQVTQLSANEQAAIDNINKNFNDIETAIKDTVSRSGNTPTHMTHDLDMNGNRIINLPAPQTDTDPVRRQDVVGDIALVQNLVNATTNAAAQTLQAAAEVQEIIQDENVGLVADDLALDENSKIRLCGSNIEDITDVADNLEDIKTVNNNKTNIDSVADNSANISAVSANKTNIDTCASGMSDINTVSGISSDVTTVAGISSNVTSVAGNATNINKVSDDLNNIDAVAEELPSIITKANKSLNNLDATGQAVINNKVDLNLNNMNPSTTSKKTIIGWGMPDYSAIVSRTKDTDYTADSCGFILGEFSGVGGEGKITINGKTYSNNGGQVTVSPMYPVSPGDTYSFTANSGYNYAFWFIPCKGV